VDISEIDWQIFRVVAIRRTMSFFAALRLLGWGVLRNCLGEGERENRNCESESRNQRSEEQRDLWLPFSGRSRMGPVIRWPRGRKVRAIAMSLREQTLLIKQLKIGLHENSG
jgi:hypothetical protein